MDFEKLKEKRINSKLFENRSENNTQKFEQTVIGQKKSISFENVPWQHNIPTSWLGYAKHPRNDRKDR